MADGRHLENGYDVITRPRMVRFGWNFVRQRGITCRWRRKQQSGNGK